MWMWAPALACGNTFVLKPSEKDPSASMLHRRAAEGGGRAGRRLQRRARRQGRGRRGRSSIRTSRRSRSSARRRSRATSTRPGTKARQARAGARRREEPHDRPPGRRHRRWPRTPRVSAAYGSAGERCMAISQVVAVGDAADRTRQGDRRAPSEDQGRQRARARRRDGAARDARAPRQGRVLHRRRARSRAPRSSPTAARTRPEGDGFFLGVSLLDNVDARDGRLQGRDLRSGARRDARRHLRRGGAAREREPVRERDGDLHARRRRCAAVPVRRAGAGWSGSTCRSRFPWRTTRSAAGRTRSSATRTSTGPRGSTSTRAAKVVTSRWPDPATSKVDLGFPQTR